MKPSTISFRLISSIAVLGLAGLAGIAFALVALDSVRNDYDDLVNRTVPQIRNGAQIAISAQEIASVGPRLSRATTIFQRRTILADLEQNNEQLDQYLAALNQTSITSQSASRLTEQARFIRGALVENLNSLDTLVERRNVVAGNLQRATIRALEALDLAERLHMPTVTTFSIPLDTPPINDSQWFSDSVAMILRLTTAINLENEMRLREIERSIMESRETLSVDLTALEEVTGDPRASSLLSMLLELSDHQTGIPSQKRELRVLQSKINDLLRTNQDLSIRLNGSVAASIVTTRQALANQGEDNTELVRTTLLVLLIGSALVVLIIIASIAFLRTQVVLRLQALRQSLVERMQGKPTPVSVSGRDEISDIAAAATHFLDTLEEREARILESKSIAERLAARADEANRAKSVFLANMSHELRTPLNAIIGFSEYLGTGTVSEEKAREYAQDINSSGSHLLSLINGLLEYSSLDSGQRSVSPQRLLLINQFQNIEPIIRKQFSDRDIKLKSEIPHDLFIRSDPVALKQIILNLLSNSAKFAFPETTTVIRAFESGNATVIEVEDKGVGISNTELERVLEPFQQERAAFGTSGAGVGLGLAISNTLVSMHGGQLKVASRKGQGTTVTVEFPISIEEE